MQELKNYKVSDFVDAEAFVIESQGSPALLESIDDVQPIVDFIQNIVAPRKAA